MPYKPPKHRPPQAHGVAPSRRQADHDRQVRRGARVYDTARWRKLRLVVLQTHPVCVDCGVSSSTEVEHVASVADRPDLAFDLDNLVGLCKPCHSRRTARHDGGFGHKRGGNKPQVPLP